MDLLILLYLHTLLIHSCHNLACDKISYNSNINLFAEETSERSKRKVDIDTPEEYLKWKFSKVKGKRGLYFEYKAVSTENTLVIPYIWKFSCYETFVSQIFVGITPHH